MKVDQILVHRIRTRVTAANVHEFNNILQCYYGFIHLYNQEPQAETREKIEKYEIKLRFFGLKKIAA